MSAFTPASHRPAEPAARPAMMQGDAVASPAHAVPAEQALAGLQSMVDGSPAVQRLQASGRVLQRATPPAAQRRPDAAPANNTGLPDGLKSGIETLSGVSLDTVRVHRNSPRPAQLNAHAFAQGNEIHLAAGQERHLPHEAWHIVQQAQGRVRPTRQMKFVQLQAGVAINDDDELEREADVMGAKAASGAIQAKATDLQPLPANADAAVQRVPKADVYRGGAELEYRQGRAEMRFQNLPVVPDVAEATIKGLVRSGIKGLPIARIGADQALTGENWSLTIETNSGTVLDADGKIAVALELILGGPVGSTLNELLVAADQSAAAINALSQNGDLHFGITGDDIRANARSKKTKIARGQAVIDDAPYVPAVLDPADPLAADWSGMQISGTWDPLGPAPSAGTWGLQVTVGVPLDELQTVGTALATSGLTDTSRAKPRPAREPDLTWTAFDILSEWQKDAAIPAAGAAPSFDALWAVRYPDVPIDYADEARANAVFAEMELAISNDAIGRVELAAQQAGNDYHAPSLATLGGLAKVLAAYARGAEGGRDQGPKHSMQFVTKNPLPAVIATAAAALPPALQTSLRNACVDLVADKVAGLSYRWNGADLPVADWAAAMRDRNVDLIAAYDARYRSAQIGGVANLNDVSAATDADPGTTTAPIIEFRDLGEKRPSQMRGVIQNIIDGLG